MLYIYLSGGHSSTAEKLSKEEQAFENKLSFSIISAHVLLWSYILINGIIVGGNYMSGYDFVALAIIGVSCIHSILGCLVFLSSYGWSRLGKVLLFVVTALSIFSVIYVSNIDRVETFEASNTNNISAKIVSKGTWSKRDSFVLVSGDKVLTYKEVVNFTDFENGDKVKSVSSGKLVITYKDLFGFTKVRTYKGQRFEKE